LIIKKSVSASAPNATVIFYRQASNTSKYKKYNDMKFKFIKSIQNIIPISIIIGILCVSVIANAQVRVTHVNGRNISTAKNGFFYYLPQTHLKIEVVVERIEKVAGPLALYAEKYLGVSGMPQSNAVKYEIKDVRFTTYAQSDPSQLYFVQVDKRSKNDKFLALSINESGVLIGVNNPIQNDLEIQEDVELKVKFGKQKNYFSYFSDYNFYKKTDTIVRRISIDTFSIEKYKFNTTLIEKNPEMKAAEIAEKLTKLRKDRYLLLTGFQEVNYGKGVSYMDGELKKIEAAYLSLFTGYTKTELIYKSFTILPDKDKNGKNVPVFRFSNSHGIYSLSSKSGTPVNINVLADQGTKNVQRFLSTAQVEPNKSTTGFYYRVPEFGEVKLTYNGRVLNRSSFLFSQFGTVVQSPSLEAILEFHPNTGGLKQLKLK
jgi:hypothetical protein